MALSTLSLSWRFAEKPWEFPTAFVTDKRYSSSFELLLIFANFSCESLQFASYPYLFVNLRGGENKRFLSTAPFRVVVRPEQSIVSQANTLYWPVKVFPAIPDFWTGKRRELLVLNAELEYVYNQPERRS